MGKKQKVGGSSKAPEASEPEKQVLETPEVPIQNPEDPMNQQDDPPPQIDITAFEPMDTDVNSTPNHDPTSPKPTSPTKSTDKRPTDNNVDDIAVTGSAFKAPEVSRVLAKHSAVEETPSLEKGKAKLDLENYSSFSAGKLPASYLSCHHASQDMEAGLVNLVKERYEVTSYSNILPSFLCTVYQLHCSPQGPVYLLKINWDFEINNTSTE